MIVSHDEIELGLRGVMINLIKKIAHDTRGATAVEYGLILALVFLAMIGAVSGFGQSAIKMWDGVSAKFLTASTK